MNLRHANDRAGDYPPSYYAATPADFALLPPFLAAARPDVRILGVGHPSLPGPLLLGHGGVPFISARVP